MGVKNQVELCILSRDVACRVSPFALYSILNLIYIYCAVYQINTVKPAP